MNECPKTCRNMPTFTRGLFPASLLRRSLCLGLSFLLAIMSSVSADTLAESSNFYSSGNVDSLFGTFALTQTTTIPQISFYAVNPSATDTFNLDVSYYGPTTQQDFTLTNVTETGITAQSPSGLAYQEIGTLTGIPFQDGTITSVGSNVFTAEAYQFTLTDATASAVFGTPAQSNFSFASGPFSVVPEPSTLAMEIASLAGLLGWIRNRRGYALEHTIENEEIIVIS